MPSTPERSFRADLQGLRAIAVGAVVLNHTTAWPHGGFIGVDVFYVISGFLITGLLLREHARTGSISFSDFYLRRARRIAPAALVVIAATTIAAFALWFTPRAAQTALDGLAAMFFTENWHLIRQGADYLQAAGPTSPLQHYWSLSVEEQFYIVWPLAVLLLLALGLRFARPSTPIRIVAVAAVALSFAWCLFATAHSGAFAYFDTFSRAWELGAGAVIALFSNQLAGIGRRLGTVLTVSGTLGLVASCFLLTSQSAFPGPWAAAPVVSTAFVIIGGFNAASISTLPLSNPLSQYVGKISYSLYLWHFPVVVFGASLAFSHAAEVGWEFVLIIGLSVLSFHFIEDPARTARWLGAGGARKMSRRSVDALVGVGVAAVLITTSAIQVVGPGAVSDASAVRHAVSRSALPATTVAPFPSEGRLSVAIDAALTSPSWPDDLEPSLNDLDSSQEAASMQTVAPGCRNTVGNRSPLTCTYNTQGVRTAFVVGDSVALSWVPAVVAALGHDWKVLAIGYANCPVAVTAMVGPSGPACTQAKRTMLGSLASRHPDLVITSSAQSSLSAVAVPADGRSTADAWRDGTAEFVKAAARTGAHVVIIGNPPAGIDAQQCATRVSGPRSCVSTLSRDWTVKSDAEQSALRAADVPHSEYIDVSRWLCSRRGLCPAYIDDTMVRFDEGHLTAAFSSRLGVVLRDRLEQADPSLGL